MLFENRNNLLLILSICVCFDSEDGLMSKMVTPVTINVDETLEVNLNLEKEKESLEINKKDENSNGKSSPHHEEDIDLPERYK